MNRYRNGTKVRRGAIAPLAALLATLLIGMLAFAIDTGYIVAVRAELQNAADAAALAAAQRLQQPFVQFYSPGQTNSGRQTIYDAVTTDTTTATSPICTAQQFGKANSAGNVSVSVLSSDVSFSYWDGTNPRVPASFPSDFPNSVTVITRRDDSANGQLKLFFGRIFGISSVPLTATATATIYAGDVSNLQVIPGVNAHILPVAYDMNFWKSFAKTGVSPDGNTYLSTNGLPQLQIYPDFKDAPGSFGLLDVGVPSNNTPAFRSWIDNGQTPNDISYLVNHNMLPVSLSAPEAWKAGPGLKSTLVTNFQSVMGDANLLPLFKPVTAYGGNGGYQAASGTGQNTAFEIVGFVGVTVTQADGSGSSGMTIKVQPMATLDPTAVISNAAPATGTTLSQFGTYQTTFVPAKLTQ
jgi:Flp pilus assembly protein TadG